MNAIDESGPINALRSNLESCSDVSVFRDRLQNADHGGGPQFFVLKSPHKTSDESQNPSLTSARLLVLSYGDLTEDMPLSFVPPVSSTKAVKYISKSLAISRLKNTYNSGNGHGHLLVTSTA